MFSTTLYIKTLPIIFICGFCIGMIIISYQKMLVEFHNGEEVIQKISYSDTLFLDNNDIEKSLRPVKILVMAFPR